jgi:hypothetical protein
MISKGTLVFTGVQNQATALTLNLSHRAQITLEPVKDANTDVNGQRWNNDVGYVNILDGGFESDTNFTFAASTLTISGCKVLASWSITAIIVPALCCRYTFDSSSPKWERPRVLPPLVFARVSLLRACRACDVRIDPVTSRRPNARACASVPRFAR